MGAKVLVVEAPLRVAGQVWIPDRTLDSPGPLIEGVAASCLATLVPEICSRGLGLLRNTVGASWR